MKSEKKAGVTADIVVLMRLLGVMMRLGNGKWKMLNKHNIPYVTGTTANPHREHLPISLHPSRESDLVSTQHDVLHTIIFHGLTVH